MRNNPSSYSALIALALSMLLAPALPVAAGNADCPPCDLRSITVDPSGPNRITGLGIDDWRQMTGQCKYDSMTNVDHTYFLNDPGWEFKTFDPPGGDTGGFKMKDFGGIADFCLRAGSTLVGYNLNHNGGNFADVGPRGAAVTGAGSLSNPGGGGHRHTAVIRCFTW